MLQKSRFHLNNKCGYLQIDFAFAVLVFIMFFFVVFSIFNSQSSNYKKSSIYAEINVEASDLCFFLVNNYGYPTNWENDILTADYVGLRSLSNFSLDAAKIAEFNSFNYNLILDDLGFDDVNLYINIYGMVSDSTYLDFGVASEDLKAYVSSTSCFSNFNGEPVVVFVEVWK